MKSFHKFCTTALFGLLIALGCGGGATETTGVDTGGNELKDVGTIEDAGGPDAGNNDGGGGDVTGADAGWTDTGGRDVVTPEDSGAPDAGVTDGGADGGTHDSGVPDAGTDGGAADGGFADGGSDGGNDTGVDAGVADGGGEGRFGVIRSRGGQVPEVQIVALMTDLGAGWVRTNVKLDGSDIDVTPMLDAGLNLVLMIANLNRGNAVSCTCGTTQGCLYQDRNVYMDQVKAAITPVLPYLAKGQKLMVQCENEVIPNASYWCGSDDQYLSQLDALHEAVKSADPSIPVVMTSLASGTLDILIDQSSPKHAATETYVTKLLTQGLYDAIDLHFYGCVEDIPAKSKWVTDRLAPGKLWISTENGGPDSRCDSPADPNDPYDYDIDAATYLQQEALQVPRRLSACADNGGAVCLWFSLFDMPNEAKVFAHMGLMEAVAPLKKKPAYDAFKTFAASHR